MIFGAPAMLAALPLVAVPIAIHLLQRRRYRRVDFAAMEFLRRAMKRLRRKVLLEDVLLLSLRTLAVAAAILALARPGAEHPPGWLAATARSEIVILDASLSMNHRSAGQTAFERAAGAAARLFEAADPRRGARAALIVAGQRAERVAAGDPAAARAALEALQHAGAGACDLAGALTAAQRTAEDFALGAAPRVTLLTDLQAYAWDFGQGVPEAFRRLALAGVEIEIVDVGAQARDNLAVAELTLPAARLLAGEPADATAVVRNFGGASAAVRAEALLDGDPVAATELEIEAGGRAEWNFAISARLAGARALEVRLAHDSLPEDDLRAAVFELSDGLELTLVGEPAARGRAPGVCDALLGYFDLGEASPLRTALLAPAALDARALADADLLVLADPGPLGARAADAAASFLRGGGGLLIALGPRTGPEDLATLVEAAGLAGVALEETQSAADPYARLEITDPDYEPLRFFADPRWRPLLTEIPFRQWRPLRVEADAGARVALRFLRGEETGGAGAALVEQRSGSGRAVWLAAAPCATWNRMEEVAGGTLALLYDLIFHLAPAAAHVAEFVVGDEFAVSLPAPPAEWVLRDPDGLRMPGAPEFLPAADGSSVRASLLPSVERAGVWSAEALLLEPDGADRRAEFRFAVNSPPAESDLRAADPDALRPHLPAGVVLRRLDQESATSAAEGAPRADYSRLLWMAVAALFTLETLLAAALDRRRR